MLRCRDVIFVDMLDFGVLEFGIEQSFFCRLFFENLFHKDLDKQKKTTSYSYWIKVAIPYVAIQLFQSMRESLPVKFVIFLELK